MAIARLIAPFSILSGRVNAPDAALAPSAVVAMPDKNGRTLMRSFVVPDNPDTLPQQQIRGILTDVSEAMQSLSQAQVEDWQAVAQNVSSDGRLGLSYRLNWNALFQQVNSYRVQFGQAITLTPPTLAAMPLYTPNAITSDDGNPDQQLSVYLTQNPTETRGYIAIRVTRALSSPARSARQNELRYPAAPVECIKAVTVSVQEYVLTATRLNVFIGDLIGLELTVLNQDFLPRSRAFVRNIEVTS